MKICPKCGYQNSANANYCIKCQASLKDVQPTRKKPKQKKKWIITGIITILVIAVILFIVGMNSTKPAPQSTTRITKVKHSTSTKNSSINRSNRSSEQQFTKDEIAVMAVAYGYKGDTPAEKMQSTEHASKLDGGDDIHQEVLSGISKKNDDEYEITEGIATTHWNDIYFDGSSIIRKHFDHGMCRSTKYIDKNELVKEYSPYKSQIDQIIQTMNNTEQNTESIYSSLNADSDND